VLTKTDLCGRGDSAQTQRKPALVPGGSVLLDDALLRGLIYHGESLWNQLGSSVCIFGFEQAAHRPKLMP